jgi:excisionase family DNA binding protein
MQNQIDRLSYSILEVAKTLGVSSRTVHSLIKRGEIPHFRVGQRVLIPADALREFIALRTKTEKS